MFIYLFIPFALILFDRCFFLTMFTETQRLDKNNEFSLLLVLFFSLYSLLSIQIFACKLSVCMLNNSKKIFAAFLDQGSAFTLCLN